MKRGVVQPNFFTQKYKGGLLSIIIFQMLSFFGKSFQNNFHNTTFPTEKGGQ